MRPIPLIFLLLLPLHAAATPALIWSQQGPDDSAATLMVREGAKGRPLVTLPVSPGYEPRASVAPRAGFIAAVTLNGSRDALRGATLQRIDLKTGTTTAIDDSVIYLQRPLALDDGRIVYVKVAHLHPVPPELMKLGELDSVTTEVRVASPDGRVRIVATNRGYALYALGVHDGELLLYRVAREEAAFYTVPLDGAGKLVRLGAAEPEGPFARDVGLLRDAAVYASKAGEGFGLYARDLRSGERRLVTKVPTDHAAPLVAGDAVVFTRPVREGAEQLVLKRGARVEALTSAEGTPFALAATPEGTQLAFRRQLPDAQELWVMDLGTKQQQKLETRGFFSVVGFGEVP